MSENGLSVLSLAQNLKYIESIHARHEEEKLVQSALGLNSRQPKPKVNKKLRCPLNLKTLWDKKNLVCPPTNLVQADNIYLYLIWSLCLDTILAWKPSVALKQSFLYKSQSIQLRTFTKNIPVVLQSFPMKM